MARVDRSSARRIMPLGLLLLAMVPVASVMAQSPEAGPGNAPSVLAPNAAVEAALQVAALVDAGRMGELWDGASPAVKRVVARAAFIEGITAARKRHGAVTGRQWLAVRRQVHDGTQTVPAGHYVSIELAGRRAGDRQLRELVSLRLDEDGTARLSGYVVE